MALTVLGARAVLIEVGAPSAARLPILVAVGVATYAGFLFWRATDVTSELRNLRKPA
jgi:hypothetical protein